MKTKIEERIKILTNELDKLAKNHAGLTNQVNNLNNQINQIVKEIIEKDASIKELKVLLGEEISNEPKDE